MQAHSSTRLLQYLSVVALLLAFVALVIPYINRAPLLDEADTFVNFTDTLVNSLFFYARPNNHFGHSFLVWVSRNTVGSTLLSLRLPTFFAGLVSLALVYRFGKLLVGHSAGLLALALLATSTTITDYAIDGRGYTLVNAFTILLLWQLYTIKPPFSRSVNYKLMATAFGLMITIPSNLVLLFGATLWLTGHFVLYWRTNQKRFAWDYFKLMFSMCFGILIAFPFYSFILLNLEAYREYSTNIGFGAMGQLVNGWLDRVFLTTPFIGTIFAVIVGLGILSALVTKRWRWLILFSLTILAVFIVGYIQLAITQQIFYPRNYLYLVPIFALVGGFVGLYFPPRVGLPIALVIFAIAWLPIQQHLGRDNSVVTVRDMVYEHLTEDDLLIVGCCYEYAMLYYTQQDPTRLFDVMTYNENKQSIVLVGTRINPVEELIIRFRLVEEGLISGIDSCAPIDEPRWMIGEFVRCPIVTS